jgi:hypothetical protein
MADRHWIDWHRNYEDPSSSISRRLEVVSRELAHAVGRSPKGLIKVLSICAGDARDIATACGDHARASDVAATVVELDTELASAAVHRLAAAGLRAQVLCADAGLTATYLPEAPYDVVLICGVFGNINSEDVRTTVSALACLVRTGGTVIWTRHRRPPDLTPSIRQWFRDEGFTELGFFPIPESSGSVGVAVLRRRHALAKPTSRIFTFVGDGADAHR